uniref:testis-specific gene 10 protein-like isoform X2 n=1 Tax=Fragaria vesca subsp. vesca TaxID=101020 RepID=UPI0005C970C6|nr:PREDICTED: testis-specific gene 10 protein-like isoform X2 [Fragaria vesca subsp. vesca]
MGRTKEVARRSTGEPIVPKKPRTSPFANRPETPKSSCEFDNSQDEAEEEDNIPEMPEDEETSSKSPKKRPCTTPKPYKSAKRPENVVDIQNSSCQPEKPQEGKASSEPEMKEKARSIDFDNLNFSYDVISRILGKANISREAYDQVLKERDLAVNKLNNLKQELKEVQNYRSMGLAEFELGKKVLEDEKKALTKRLDESELATKVLKAEKKALTERLDKEFCNFAAELKEVLESLSRSKAELERTSQERDGYRNSFELGKKEWEDEKKSLSERLNKEFNNFGAELKQVLGNLSKSEAELEKTSQERDTYRNSLELGDKVWEAERIEMANKEKENAIELGKKVAEAERIDMAERTAMTNKEKEMAYCKGYLDGWFKKPHAYVHAWHIATLANEITDLPVLQIMNNLPNHMSRSIHQLVSAQIIN